MREILFRGKSKSKDEVWGVNKWCEGYLFDDGAPGDKKYFIGALTKPYAGAVYVNMHCEVDPDTVSQYTGLTDENGKKIFEGDILQACLDENFPEDVTTAKVVWEDCGFRVKESKYPCEDLTADDCKNYWEVVGNIWDNPELLEG